jgi:hypothetical protein
MVAVVAVEVELHLEPGVAEQGEPQQDLVVVVVAVDLPQLQHLV